MKQYYSILMSTFALMIVSCTNETEVLVADFDKFVTEASEKYSSCDDATWMRLSDEYQKIHSRYFQLEDKLSEQDKEKIDILKGRFSSIKVKYEARRLKEKIKSEYDKAKGFVDEFFSDP